MAGDHHQPAGGVYGHHALDVGASSDSLEGPLPGKAYGCGDDSSSCLN